MNRIFDQIKFDGKLLIIDHYDRATLPFDGYYHWHQGCEILFIHAGEGTIIVNQHAYEIERGMLFLFQPFQLHKVYPRISKDKPYERTKIYFNPEELSKHFESFPSRFALLQKLWLGKNIKQVFDLDEGTQLLEQLLQYYEQDRRKYKEPSQEETVLLMLQILGLLQRSHAPEEAANPFLPIEKRPLRYSERIMQWIEEHYSQEVSLDRIASELHLSKFYVSRVFRQETGSSITDYLTARRMKQACRLLQTTLLPVEKVGIEVGLPDVSYFVQLFKKVVGTTPLKYRNQ